MKNIINVTKAKLILLVALATGLAIFGFIPSIGEGQGSTTKTQDNDQPGTISSVSATVSGGFPKSADDYVAPTPGQCNDVVVQDGTRKICNIFDADRVLYDRSNCMEVDQGGVDRKVCKVHNSNLWGVVGFQDIYVDELLSLIEDENDPLKNLTKADTGCVAGSWISGAVTCPKYAATPFILADSSKDNPAKLCNHGPFQPGDGSGRSPSSPVSVKMSNESFHGCVQLWFPHENQKFGDGSPGLFIPWKEVDFPSMLAYIDSKGADDGDWCVEAPPRWVSQSSNTDRNPDCSSQACLGIPNEHYGLLESANDSSVCVGKPCDGTPNADLCIPGEERGKKPTDPKPNPKPQVPEWSKPQHVAGGLSVHCDSDPKYIETDSKSLRYDLNLGTSQVGYSFKTIRVNDAERADINSFTITSLTGKNCDRPGEVSVDRILVPKDAFVKVDRTVWDAVSCSYYTTKVDALNRNIAEHDSSFIVLKSTCELSNDG